MRKVQNHDTSFRQPLILLDIDNTLIVSDDLIYKSPALKNKIQHIQQCGLKIGISTNRSYEMSWPVYQYLGLSGPLLTEMGASYTFERYYAIRRLSMLLLLSLVKAMIVVYARAENMEISISKKRRYSISVAVAGSTNAYGISKFIDKFSKILPCLTDTYNSDNGRIYIRYKNITKHAALEKIAPLYKAVYAIGDAEFDKASKSIHYLGVVNAEDSYKMICEYCTSKSGEDGIIDLLDYSHKMSAI